MTNVIYKLYQNTTSIQTFIPPITNLNSISKLSIGLLSLSALSFIPQAQAGPIAAAACFAACEALLLTLAPPAAVAYAPHCFAGCKIALLAPTP